MASPYVKVPKNARLKTVLEARLPDGRRFVLAAYANSRAHWLVWGTFNARGEREQHRAQQCTGRNIAKIPAEFAASAEVLKKEGAVFPPRKELEEHLGVEYPHNP